MGLACYNFIKHSTDVLFFFIFSVGFDERLLKYRVHGLSPQKARLAAKRPRVPGEAQYSRNAFLLSHLNPLAPGEAVDGHILAFSNCYMLFFFRLQARLPEESLALFLEPK